MIKLYKDEVSVIGIVISLIPLLFRPLSARTSICSELGSRDLALTHRQMLLNVSMNRQCRTIVYVSFIIVRESLAEPQSQAPAVRRRSDS